LRSLKLAIESYRQVLSWYIFFVFYNVDVLAFLINYARSNFPLYFVAAGLQSIVFLKKINSLALK